MKRFCHSIISCFVTVSIIMIVFCSCGKEKVNTSVSKYKGYSSDSQVESSTVAENDLYELLWNNEQKYVTLVSKITNESWSTIPDEIAKGIAEAGLKNTILSPLNVSYIPKNTETEMFISGYSGSVIKNTIECKTVQNGICVSYYFDAIETKIPVYYLLAEDGIRIEIKPQEIEEHDNYITEIAIAPFLCSAQNSSENYVFVPMGSGGLMYTDVREGQDSRYFSADVYGRDYAVQVYQKNENNEDIKLPVFGVKNNDSAMLAIIENGAESAKIYAEVGNEKASFSSVYASFILRGTNIMQTEYGGNFGKVETLFVGDEIINEESMSVLYHPLEETSADYNGMAKYYREYLKEKNAIENNGSNGIFNLNILGGFKSKTYFLGLPYDDVKSFTTISNAQKILEELSAALEIPFSVILKGFGDNGIDIGKIGGGFTLASKLGSKKDIKSLQNSCNERNINLYMDFDIIYFNNSSNGFSSSFDVVKTCNGFKAYQYHYSTALRNIDEKKEKYLLLSREELNKAADKAYKVVERLGIDGISFSTLGKTKYSDYNSDKYIAAADMVADVSGIMTDSNSKIAVNNASIYAAIKSDLVTETPTNAGMQKFIDIEIPFYQMTLKGLVSLTGESINLGQNKHSRFLKSIETGCALSFTVVDEYNPEYAMSTGSSPFASVYDDNKTNIIEMVNNSKDYLLSVIDCGISSYEIINNNIRKTVFENGTTVYVNYSEEAASFDGITIEGYSYEYK